MINHFVYKIPRPACISESVLGLHGWWSSFNAITIAQNNVTTVNIIKMVDILTMNIVKGCVHSVLVSYYNVAMCCNWATNAPQCTSVELQVTSGLYGMFSRTKPLASTFAWNVPCINYKDLFKCHVYYYYHDSKQYYCCHTWIVDQLSQ